MGRKPSDAAPAAIDAVAVDNNENLLSEAPIESESPTTIPQESVVGDDDDLTTDLGVLSGGLVVEEVPTTEGVDYDILIQGSDRKYPAIVIRRKHRGVGATIKTISKRGKHAAEYDEWKSLVEGYLARRAGRTGAKGSGHAEDRAGDAREAWVDKTIQGVVKRPEDGESSVD